MPDLDAIRRRLDAIGQGHVLRFLHELPPDGQRGLLEQIDTLDVRSLPALIERYVLARPSHAMPADIEPVPFYPLHHLPRAGASQHRAWNRDAFRSVGEELVRKGKVAAFTVAGGQGSRLGFDGPKGLFMAGAVTRKALFQCLADWIVAAQERYGATIPWYVMTSPLNHGATVGFFEAHNYLGLARHDVVFFQQGVMPSFDLRTGKMLLAATGEIAANPDGHGGSLRAMAVSGALDDMRQRGVEHISYTQVDNPLVRVIDPVFLGLHASAPDSSGEMSSKIVPKAHAAEKVGVFCRAGGKTRIIEYSDMPERLAHDVWPDGSLRFAAGNIAVHVIGRAFVERLNNLPGVGHPAPKGAEQVGPGQAHANGGAFALPYHRAEKKVAHIDLETGHAVEPREPNAVKLETFVFDAIPLAESSIVLETDRIEEFAPIKNADGADSPRTCREIQTERAARWLESVGVAVPRGADGRADCVLEISARTAMWAEDLRRADGLPRAVERGAELAL